MNQGNMENGEFDNQGVENSYNNVNSTPSVGFPRVNPLNNVRNNPVFGIGRGNNSNNDDNADYNKNSNDMPGMKKGDANKNKDSNDMPGAKKNDDSKSNNGMPGMKKSDDNKGNNGMPGMKKDSKDNNKNKDNKKSLNDKSPKGNKEGNKGNIKKPGERKNLNPLARLNPLNRLGLRKSSTVSSSSSGDDGKSHNKFVSLFMKLPLVVKVKIVAGASVVLLLFIVFFLVMSILGATTAVIAASCSDTEYDVNGADTTAFLCSMASPFGDNEYTVSGTSGWRVHPTEGITKFHYGTDVYANGSDLSIYAVQDGIIEEIKYNGGWGNTILINHGEFTTRYAHLSAFESGLEKGDEVKQGQKIGTEGTTGTSTGNHLHFELRNSQGDYLSANPFFGYSDQGYESCINPSSNPDMTKCSFDKNQEARYIGEEGFNQICGKTGNYTNSDNSSCCESDNKQDDGDSTNIREFINVFEGSGGYCDSAKTQYKAYQNSNDRVTIGYGVTSDYVKGLKLGQCISVSEVDAAEDKAIDSKRNSVIKPIFMGVNLTKYQEDALTSMAYNGCGTYFKGIATAAGSGDLKKVWEQMKGCTNGGMLGLQRRRKAEFALYVTGDYNVASKYKNKTWTKDEYDDYDSDGVIAKKASGTSSTCAFSGSSSGTDVVKRAQEEYEKWNDSTPTERNELLENYIEACGGGRKCLPWCAGFVTYILKETGKLDNVKGYSCMANSYRSVTPAEHHKQGSGYTPQPGDVIVYATREHVALVEKVKGKTVYLIGGNQTGKNTATCTSNAITKRTISVDSSDIYEYVTIG